MALLASLAFAAPAGAALPNDFFGIYWEQIYPPFAQDRGIDMTAQHGAGIDIVRQPFDWGLLEPEPGKFEFDTTDAYMADAARAGMQVLPIIVDPPVWAGKYGDRTFRRVYPPKSPELIEGISSALTARYGRGGSFWKQHPELQYLPIRAWQIWNEPNLFQWWYPEPNVGEYVAVLAAASRAIKRVDPDAEIVAAGVPDSKSEGAVPMDEWLESFYDAGARGKFDTIAVHPYATDASGAVDIVEVVRGIMDRHGDRDSKIWATELGWATGGTRAHINTTDEPGQAKQIAALIDELVTRRGELGIRGLVYYNWRNVQMPPAQDLWMVNSGLLRSDRTPKPGYFAYRDGVLRWRALDGSDATRTTPEAPAGSALPSTYRLKMSAVRRGRASRDWRFPVRLACGTDASTRCTGQITFDQKSSGGRRPKQLALRQFRLRAGVSALLRVRLSKGARKELLRHGRVKIRARATSIDAVGRVVEASRAVTILKPRRR